MTTSPFLFFFFPSTSSAARVISLRIGSFSIQFVSSVHKSLVYWTFLPAITAEIHIAVRKQLLFIEGRGWCNFNFKDVLNELPQCDWLAEKRASCPSVFQPRALITSPLYWCCQLQCDMHHVLYIGRMHFTTMVATLYSIIAHNVSCWKCIVIKVQWYCLGIKAFSIHRFTYLLTLTYGLNRIWYWLMNNHV